MRMQKKRISSCSHSKRISGERKKTRKKGRRRKKKGCDCDGG